jgi:hypothetical protein
LQRTELPFHLGGQRPQLRFWYRRKKGLCKNFVRRSLAPQDRSDIRGAALNAVCCHRFLDILSHRWAGR